MRYEIYLDSVVVLTFVFNVYQLWLVKKILACTATQKRIILAAFLGALTLGITLVIPFSYLYVRMFVGTFFAEFLMIRLGFQEIPVRYYRHVLSICLVCSFLQSGLVVRLGSMFQRTRQKVFVFLPLILWFVQFVLTKLFFRKKSDVIEVEIPVGKTICRLKAFLDSGNTLYDPIFNMPVNIVSKEVTKDFEALLTPDRYLLIPYRSVGCKKGMLPAYRIPEMIVKTGVEDRHIKNVVLAITNQGIQPDDSYQMILHPAIFCKEEKR